MVSGTLIEVAKEEIQEQYKKAVISSIKYRLKSIADKEREIEAMKKELEDLNLSPYEESVRKYGMSYGNV